MDDLVEAFAGSQVTLQQNSTSAVHPHFALYKAKSSSIDQEARRKKFLEAQKLKRFDFASHARGLATNTWDEEVEEDEDDEMEIEYIKPPRSFKNQLMLSEWLVEVPNDFEDQWYLVFCPIGKRCLIVASRGYTKVYTKSGYCINSFPSFLPGGHKSVEDGPLHVYTLLDCIYDELSKTFYVLDVMCWNSHPCFDSETEFRFYWLHSKLDECTKVKEITKKNPYKFIPLPYFNCDSQSIRDALFASLPFPSKLDGLLFYHKRTHYNCGTTPLVGWLKGYMVPEILNIAIPETLEKEKPLSYVMMEKHVPEAFKKHAERKVEDERNMQYEDD